MVASDYGFLDEGNLDDTEGSGTCVPFLSMMDTSAGYIGTSMVRAKGADEFSVNVCTTFLEELGYLRIEGQSDGETSIIALLKAVRLLGGLLKTRLSDYRTAMLIL